MIRVVLALPERCSSMIEAPGGFRRLRLGVWKVYRRAPVTDPADEVASGAT
jgi:hypothetical protein